MSAGQDPLAFLLILLTIDPCVFSHMSHFISQRLHSFTQVTTQNHITSTGKMLLLCQLVQDCSWCLLKDLRNMLPTSNNEQCTSGNSGFRGLSGWYGSSLCWDILFFSIVTLPSSNTFFFVFQRLQDFFQDTTYKQINSTQFFFLLQTLFSHLMQEDPANTP
jgi:hypothetical protein